MSGESATKPRLVLCPKCWQLLPESPDYDVYKCGGCGITLQAKKRRSGAVNSESSSHETNAADDKQDSKEDQLATPQENGLRLKASSSSSEECSIDGNGAIDQIENGKCNRQQLVLPPENGAREEAYTTSSGEYSLDGSIRRGRIENGEGNGELVVLPQENGLRGKAITSSSGEYSLDENDGRVQTEDEKCKGEKLDTFNLSDEELEKEMDSHKLSDIRKHRVSNNCCSDELTNSEIEVSTELTIENSVEGGPREERIHALDEEDVNNEKSALAEVKPEENITGSEVEGAKELNNEDLLLEGAEQELISGSDEEEADIERSALVGANHEVDITKRSNAVAKESNNRNLLSEEADKELNIYALNGEDSKNDQSALVGEKTEVEDTSASSEKGSTSNKIEEGTSTNYVSSPNEHLRQAEKNILHHNFNRVRSVDTLDAAEVINPSSELSGNLGELSKSQTTRSSHAYEGSVSSNDVADDVLETRSRKGKGLVDNMLYGVLETQQESYFPNAKHQAMKTRRDSQIQNQVPETTRHGHPHWARTRGDEFPSKIPFHRNSSQSGYESGSPSNQTHDDLYYSPSFLSPDTYEDPNQEKMKLLRMVYELHDQLNRTSYMNRETNARLSYTGASYKGKHISAYHSHDLHEGRFHHGPDYLPRCDGRCSHAINSRQMHNFSPPYVAETTTGTHHVDHRCLHCRPQERQCSAELCRPYPAHNCCSSHHSYPSSPQWLMASKLQLHSHEIKSGDQRHMAPQVKKYLKEKQNLTKRHYRPVAGGAPFVTCHKCFRLLQLPADFLLFKRVCHPLKCGACSEVLKFSLQNRSHIVSYSQNAIGLPSSDLDDQNEVINGSNLHSASHGNHHRTYSRADPVSYSDDYGRSVSKSYSSEEDPVSVTPSHLLHGTEYDNSSVSRGTYQPITEEKIGSGGEKLASEMEARSPQKSSTLHQLMGYSSPIQLIRSTATSVEGKESILKEEDEVSHSSQQR